MSKKYKNIQDFLSKYSKEVVISAKNKNEIEITELSIGLYLGNKGAITYIIKEISLKEDNGLLELSLLIANYGIMKKVVEGGIIKDFIPFFEKLVVQLGILTKDEVIIKDIIE